MVEDLEQAIAYLSDFVKTTRKGSYLTPALKELKAAHLLKRRVGMVRGAKGPASGGTATPVEQSREAKSVSKLGHTSESLHTLPSPFPSLKERADIATAQEGSLCLQKEDEVKALEGPAPQSWQGSRPDGIFETPSPNRSHARNSLPRQVPNEQLRASRPNDVPSKTSGAGSARSIPNSTGNPYFARPAGSHGAISSAMVRPRPSPPATTNASIVSPTISDGTSPKRSQPIASRRYVVVIDPGHGGKDPGAVSKNGKTKEKDVALEISDRIKNHLIEKVPGVRVELTRSEDKFLSLQERTAIANSLDADLFLSIHCNGADDSVSKGVETFFLSKAGSSGAMRVAARENGIPMSKMSDLEATLVDLMVTAKKTESHRLAHSVHRFLVQHLKKSHPSRDRGVKGAPFYVLMGAKMPAALIECAFISSRNEQERLTSSKHLDAISQGIAEGAKSYLEGLGEKG